MIDVEDLRKTYYVHKKPPGLWGSVRSLFLRKKIAKQAVRDVSLHVAPGEILGLVGPNGAGKTTLVKMLAGIIHPSGGRGEACWARTPWLRNEQLPAPDRIDHGAEGPALVGPAGGGLLPAAEGDLPHPGRRVPPRHLDYLSEVLDVKDQLHSQVQVRACQPRRAHEDGADRRAAAQPKRGLSSTSRRSASTSPRSAPFATSSSPTARSTSSGDDPHQPLHGGHRAPLRAHRDHPGGSVRLRRRRCQEVVETYAPHKVVTAHLRKVGGPVPFERWTLGRASWRGLEATPRLQVTLCVCRAHGVAEGLGTTPPHHFPVADLAIDEDGRGRHDHRAHLPQDGACEVRPGVSARLFLA